MSAENPRGTRVALRTLGCKVNRADSDALAARLEAVGAVLVDERDADVVVVNSCTVTAEADAKTRKAVRQALGLPGAPLVVVTGCAAAIERESLAALGGRVVVEPEKARLVEVVQEAARDLPGSSRGPQDLASGHPGAGHPRRLRVAVKVQDGCDERCAYCIVPDARGPARSSTAEEVVEQVSRLVASGTAEIVLTGVNIGRFRDDGDAGESTDLAGLVERVAATGVSRIRISSIEPQDLTPALLDTLSRTAAVVPHLHVPLQSGCDLTLARMARRYDTATFARHLEGARTALPGLAVTTDVIVGFPGETVADFEDSLAFVESAGFTRLHVFRYSPRRGTPAASMPGQVTPAESESRSSAMRSLGERLASVYAKGRVGGRASVLVEAVEGHLATGTSEDYLRVGFPPGATPVEPGEIVEVELTAAERGAAFGRRTR